MMTVSSLRGIVSSWPTCDFWDCRLNTDRLSCNYVLEAVELDVERHREREPDGRWHTSRFGEVLSQLYPEGVVVYGWTRRLADGGSVGTLVDALVDAYVDAWTTTLELGDPEQDDPEPVDALRAALVGVVAADVKDRQVWRCDRTHEVRIPLDVLLDLAPLEWPGWFGLD